jgi:phosphoribosylformylglycinamidine synthase
VQVEVTSSRSALTSEIPLGQRLRIPINHFEGNYICDKETLAELRADDRVVLRYIENPNGSIDNIAGICNPAGNVVGLMPHPERATDGLLGSDDGSLLLRSLLHSAATPGMPTAAAAAAGRRSEL